MAIPAATKIWAETMDPYDLVDYKIDLSPLLTTGEGINSVVVSVPASSALYGLTVGSTSRAPVLTGTDLTVWLSIDSAFQAEPKFIKGLTLSIEVTITTDSTPSRRKQRSVAVKVIQR